MNLKSLNRRFEEPAPESSIRKARTVDGGAPREPPVGTIPIAERGLEGPTALPEVTALPAVSATIELDAGTVLNDKYRIERKVGEGAMGVIFAATHLGLDETVAIKFMRREVQDVEGTLARFANEAKIAARIRSEHVTKVLDVGVSDSLGPFIVMEYLEGRTLADVLYADGPLPPQRLVECVLQACEALAAAHAAEVVHRDVKPDNLFVARQGGLDVIKLLDFGISKAPRGGTMLAGEVGRQTTSVAMGTPLYMSPEQLRSTADVDSRTDIWSLGAAMYELSCGEPPFKADSVAEIIAAILDDAPAELPPSCPAALRDAIVRCLLKEPAARFQSVGELAQALMPLASADARAHASRASCILRSSLLQAYVLPSSPDDAGAPQPIVGAAELSHGSVPELVRPPARQLQSSAWVATATVLALGALGVAARLAQVEGPHGEPLARPTGSLQGSATAPRHATAPAGAWPAYASPGVTSREAPSELPSLSGNEPAARAPAPAEGEKPRRSSASRRATPGSRALARHPVPNRAAASAHPASLPPSRVRLVAPRKVRLVAASAQKTRHERAR
jgi:eukaryotic-like serine/threonine-protein kinase